MPSDRRWLVLVVLSVALGAVSSWISGELAVSAIYILIDVTQVLGASLATSGDGTDSALSAFVINGPAIQCPFF